jgi:hypothetical protein
MGDFDLGLMPFRQQLTEFPPIKEMLKKNVRNPKALVDPGVTWRVYGRREEGGSWGQKKFPTYFEAFQFMKPRLKTYYDISITSTRLQFLPPGRVVKIKRRGQPVMVKTPKGEIQMTKIVPIHPPPGHLWCKYCRRFSVFLWFSRHHAFPKHYNELLEMDPRRRCAICGVSEEWGAWRR